MPRGSALKVMEPMTHDDQTKLWTERFERGLVEEIGGVRLEVSALRAEMIDRSSDQLKWLLAFFVAQTAALAALMALFR